MLKNRRKKDNKDAKTNDVNKKKAKVEESLLDTPALDDTVKQETEVDYQYLLKESQKEILRQEENLKISEQKIMALEERLIKLQAEYDNFRKRSTKEKDELSEKTIIENSAKWLSIVDNLERAVGSDSSFKTVDEALEGIRLIYRQAQNVLNNLELVPFKTLGESFDPNKHNAIMHELDPTKGEKEIVAVFEQGYERRGQIVRLSLVKVAN